MPCAEAVDDESSLWKAEENRASISAEEDYARRFNKFDTVERFAHLLEAGPCLVISIRFSVGRESDTLVRAHARRSYSRAWMLSQDPEVFSGRRDNQVADRHARLG